jgi:hypothetical protein
MEDGMSDFDDLIIECTARGKHPAARLARLRFVGDVDPGNWRGMRGAELHTYPAPIRILEMGRHRTTVRQRDDLDRSARTAARGVASQEHLPEGKPHQTVSQSGTVWRFKCSRCGRDVPITEENLRKLAADWPARIFDLSLWNM